MIAKTEWPKRRFGDNRGHIKCEMSVRQIQTANLQLNIKRGAQRIGLNRRYKLERNTHEEAFKIHGNN